MTDREWRQRCISCDGAELRGSLEGLSIVCDDCGETFPAIVGADEYPPTAPAVKLHGPPGTGKTTQLVRRIEELLRAGYSLGDMTVITYRREMARDILAKLYERDLISTEELRKPWSSSARYVGTLHAVCNRLVDVDPPEGLAREKADYCRDVWGVEFYRARDETTPTPGELMFSARSWMLENLVEWDQWDRTPQYEQILEVWSHHPDLSDFHYKWEDWKAQHAISDFDDMLVRVYKEGISPKTAVVAADEYHDFTPLQNAIVQQWMKDDATDVRIVDGDPLQVVYSYAGADARFYEELPYPEVLLPRSFRVPRRVWEYASRALEPEYSAPPIEPKREAGEVLERDSVPLHGDAPSSEGGLSPVDFVDQYGENIMYLTRTRSQARDVSRALKAAGVIHYGQEGTGAWNQSRKRLSLYNCLQRLEGIEPPTGVAHDGQQGLTAYGSTASTSSAVESVRLYTDELADFLDRVPAEYIDGGKKTAITKITGSGATLRAAELDRFVQPGFWDTFTEGADSVGELLTYDDRDVVAKALRRYDAAISPRDVQRCARVLTIHASKGQEAETVVLYDGITKRISTSMSRLPSEQRNEARLWYVGATRAAERLIVARGGWNWTYEYLPDVDPVAGVDRAGVPADD